MNPGQIILRAAIVGIEPQGLAELRRGLCQLALLGESDTQVIMDLGIIGVEVPEGPPKVRQGFFDAPMAGENVAEIELGFDVVRIELQGF